MFKRLVQWHRDWEDEILGVLADVSRIDSVPPGYRKHWATQMLKLSPIERRQLLEFSTKYRGWNGYAQILKVLGVFSLAGLALHLSLPAKFGPIESVLLANLLGLSFLFGLVGMWFNYRKMKPSLKNFAIGMLMGAGGALVGASVSAFVDNKPVLALLERIGPTVVLAGLGVGALYALLFGAVRLLRMRDYEILNAKLLLEAEQERMSRQLSESRLRLLQAQIEPHFLFNTLGAVQQLAQAECPRAADLTANLITFLRATLSEMRTESTTLAAEFALIEAYLKVMQIRLGSRLTYSLSLAPEFADVQIPGMLVLTLVENSIKHGLEPSLRGGSVEVSVSQTAHEFQILVHDTGVGLASSPTWGVGLSNVQERLQLAYGGAGHLTLQDNEPQGTKASITFPAPAKDTTP